MPTTNPTNPDQPVAPPTTETPEHTTTPTAGTTTAPPSKTPPPEGDDDDGKKPAATHPSPTTRAKQNNTATRARHTEDPPEDEILEYTEEELAADADILSLPKGVSGESLHIGGQQFTMPCWSTYQGAIKTALDLKDHVIFLTVIRRLRAKRYISATLINAALGKERALRIQTRATLQVRSILSHVDQSEEKFRLEAIRQMMGAMRSFSGRLKSMINEVLTIDDHSNDHNGPPPPLERPNEKLVHFGINTSRSIDFSAPPAFRTPHDSTNQSQNLDRRTTGKRKGSPNNPDPSHPHRAPKNQ